MTHKEKLIIFYGIVLITGTLAQFDVDIVISGWFYECTDYNSNPVPCIFGNNTVNWGNPIIDDNRSGLEFIGGNVTIIANEENPIVIGYLRHHNWPINGNETNIPAYVKLVLTLRLYINITNTILYRNVTFTLNVHETENRATKFEDVCPFENATEWFGLYNTYLPCCPYYTENNYNGSIAGPCSDRIKFNQTIDEEFIFQIEETEYTLIIRGIINNQIPTNEVINAFITQEKLITQGSVLATITALCAENTTCDDGKQCTVDECIDGFCFFDSEPLNGTTCNYNQTRQYGIMQIDNECYDYICINGNCITVPYDCPSESSSESSLESSSESSSESDGGDGNLDGGDGNLDGAIIAGLISTATLLYCIPLLCIPILTLLLIPFIIYISKTIPTTVGIRGPDPIEMGNVVNNPTYNDLTDTMTNPLFE